ncbi:hypothetical protein [Pedobacter deserti]|uniref:hypothetical protein n=1 Tax=Pedobacter deserti TaxID=2817382 RepID=UPI00210D95FF|nr:hypothetical protein [Pedobacter sp. SYSU D00382]
MSNPLAVNPDALHLFFTDDIYMVSQPSAPIAPDDKPEPPPVFNFEYLGGNKRNILILVYDEEYDVSSETGRELLRKIVKSVNLATPDFALLNYARYKNADYEALGAFFDPKFFFAFGVTPAMLRLPTAPARYQLTSEGNVRLIFSAGLKELDQDPASKKLLWNTLKTLEF